MTRIRLFELDEAPARPTSVDEKAVVTVLRVPPESSGMRLDRFVQSQLKRTSRTRAQVIIDNSAFARDGRALRPGGRVRAEQLVFLWRPPWDEARVAGELPILYEDDQLIAIDKPAHVPVHPTARYYRSTVVKMLEEQRPDGRMFLAHRLDKETSGALLLSKTPEADRHVKKQFAGIDPETDRPAKARLVDKTYQAIVHGWPEQDGFTVSLPLEEDSASRLRVKMRVAERGGLASTTVVRVIERRRRAVDGRRYALVECDLHTGRQHQIRVHLSALGFPLVGDKLYGDDEERHARGSDNALTEEDLAQLELPRHALHAQTLELLHPTRGDRVRIEAPLARDLAQFLASLV